jgi:ABC-type uncharacterized transport system permease subunit
MGGTISGLLQTVTGAVTPVVLISASAVLIMGVNVKHQAHAKRLRALSAELREGKFSPIRLACIHAQIKLFLRRYRLSQIAHLLLYLSVICYCLMVLVLALFVNTAIPQNVVPALLFAGIALTLFACTFEVMESQLGKRTIEMEIASSMEECELESRSLK